MTVSRDCRVHNVVCPALQLPLRPRPSVSLCRAPETYIHTYMHTEIHTSRHPYPPCVGASILRCTIVRPSCMLKLRVP
ncbi:hypothetical protein L209DRAFT_747569 [Thermothelomyces heterothallicus CBS 203.75]